MRRLILASGSAYRRALLERLRLPFDVVAPGVVEDALDGEAPEGRALRLAVAKAQAVAERYPDATVIGSDQVAASGAHELGKPGNAERCRAQLGLLNGSIAEFHTGCAVVGSDSGLRLAHVDTTRVHFRTLRREEIGRYVDREQPFDCAGGFKAEGLGITLFERIESSDPTALIGLPLIWLASALRKAGYDLP